MKQIIASCLLFALLGCEAGGEDWIAPILIPDVTVIVDGETIDSYYPYQSLTLELSQNCSGDCRAIDLYNVVIGRYRRIDVFNWQPELLNVDLRFEFTPDLVDRFDTLTLADLKDHFENVSINLRFAHTYVKNQDGVLLSEVVIVFDSGRLERLGISLLVDNTNGMRLDLLAYDGEYLQGKITGTITVLDRYTTPWYLYPDECRGLYYHTLPEPEDKCQTGGDISESAQDSVYLPFSVEFTLPVTGIN